MGQVIETSKIFFRLEGSLCSDRTAAGPCGIWCPAGLFWHKWHQREGMWTQLLLFAKYYWTIVLHAFSFFLLNPPTGSEYARTGQLRWGGFLYFVSFCWVPCLLEMWKALEHKRTNKRLDSTQRCCKLAFMYLPHLKSDWLFYILLSCKSLERFELVLSRQFMPLIRNWDMSFCHGFHRRQLWKWLWQQKSEFWIGASWRLFGIKTKRHTNHTQMQGTPVQSALHNSWSLSIRPSTEWTSWVHKSCWQILFLTRQSQLEVPL